MDEAGRLDHPQAGVGQPADELGLDLDGQGGLLVLQPVAGADLVDRDALGQARLGHLLGRTHPSFYTPAAVTIASVMNPASRPSEQPVGEQVGRFALRRDAEQLGDDVDDRAGGEGEEDDADRLAGEAVPDGRADERRAAADEGQAEQERPAGPAPVPSWSMSPVERRDDAEALGGVVQAEADDQQGRERDLVARGRLADGQPLGEVVQADADGDQQGQPPRG